MPNQNHDFTVPDAVAVPMVALDGHGIVRGANQAFASASGLMPRQVIGQSFVALCEGGGAHALDAVRSVRRAIDARTALDGVDLRLRRHDARWWSVRLSARPVGATAIWLTLVDRSEVQRAERLQELLNMAQQFGRLGVWERDVQTMQGHWDQHMYRFWGLSTDDAVPAFAQAADYVVPEDRQAMQQKFMASVKTPGNYSHHYRVRGADGVLRRLHSQWQVKSGPSGSPESALGVMMDDTEVWQLAQTVDEAHAQLELALQLSGIAIWRHDLSTNRLYYDDQGWQILGLPARPEGLSLDEVRAMIHPDDLPGVQAAMQRAAHNQTPTDMEARYRHADGHWLDILTRRVTQRDTAGRPIAFVGVAMDITARVEEQRRLLDLTRRLDLAASAAGVAIWSHDFVSGQAHWNAQMYALHGVEPDRPPPDLATYLQRFVPPEARAAVAERTRQMAELVDDRVVRSDMQIVRADGTRRDVAVRALVLHHESGMRMLGTLIDVTEQRAAGRALREAHERAALVAKAVGMGSWDYDMASGEGTWDEQMWRLRGLEPRGPQAMSQAERQALVHPDDLTALEREYDESAREQRGGSAQFRVRWPDGSWHWIASRSQPFFDEQGREVRRIGVNWDITQAREIEQARQERVLAQRESRAKSQFLARMSHELRTPLNAVIGFAQLLLADGSSPIGGEPREQLQHIRDAGRHLLALVDDVLDLSSLDTGEIRLDVRTVSLRELFDAAAPMVRALAVQHEVQLAAGELAHTVLADPTRLRQVLLNLLTNAIKYNRRGGHVHVQAHELGTQVALIVRDTGRGMASEQLAHAFEPFNRLGLGSRGIEGTGIGLAIVEANVARMGGSVHVQSTPGVGSVFEVRLPRAPGAASPSAEEPHGSVTVGAAPMRGARLLYIEDNPVNALIVRELVSQRSHLTLDEADDGVSGIHRARSARPDLILLDMQLPDIDGLEVLRRLRADPITAAIPCIALSANAMREDIEFALGAGFADYWTKPLDFRVFLGALDTLFGGDEPPPMRPGGRPSPPSG